MKKLVVTIDSGDGDYRKNIAYMNDISFETLFLPVIEAIRNFKPYLNEYGVCIENWPSRCENADEYRSPKQLYPQLTEKQINDFENVCLGGFIGFPDGVMTIVRIVDAFTGTVYVDGDPDRLMKVAETMPMIREYWTEDIKFYTTIAHTGKYLHEEKFSNMTAEELKLCEEHDNLWKRISEKYE